MEDQVKGILSKVFGVDVSQITDAIAPGKLKAWDSIRHMKMILALEEEFSVEFEPEDIGQMLNLKLIMNILNEKL